MTKLLVRLFVKNYEKTDCASVRTAYGVMASLVGICCNLFLFASKMTAGFLTGSISIMADAFNNLSDAASSIIGFVGVKMAQKPPDREHPFGHGRIEYISAFIVAFIVVQVGFSLFKTSVDKVIHPEDLSFSKISIAILVLSIGVKLWMAVFNRTLGKRIHSTVMLATSADSLGDVVATSSTIFSMMVYGIWKVNIDGLVGVVVSVLVLIAGINIAKETLEPLIGGAIDPKLYKKISDFVGKYHGILGTHDLIVHNYGPDRSMASIHVEVAADVPIETTHTIVDKIERDAYRELGVMLVIHMDPVDLHNTRATELKKKIIEIINGLDSRLSIHDFRLVQGTKRRNLIFDLVVPRDYTEQMEDALKEQICQKISEQDETAYCIIQMEHSYEEEDLDPRGESR